MLFEPCVSMNSYVYVMFKEYVKICRNCVEFGVTNP